MDVIALGAKGSLFVTRPTIMTYTAQRAVGERRTTGSTVPLP